MKTKIVGQNVLLKSVFWYTSSNFFTKAIAFITVPFFTRILSKEEFGDFTVFASWQTLLVIICGMEAYGTINKARFDYRKKEAFESYISSTMVLTTLFTAVFFGVYLLIPSLFDDVFLLDKKYMLMMFAYLFMYPAFSMFQAKQRIEYKYKLSSAIAFSVGITSSIFSVILAVSLENDRLFGRIFGQYMPYVAVGACFFIYFIYCSHKVVFSSWRYTLSLSMPLVFSALGNQVFVISNNLLVKHMCSAQEVSYIAITVSCNNIILLLVRAINSAWAPWLYDMLNIGNERIVKKIFQTYLWMVIVVTFVIMLIGPEIVAVLGGTAYKEAIYILPVSILCGIFLVLISQFVNLEIYYKKQKYVIVLTMFAAILNICIGIAGVKIWGYQAVCYATAISQMVMIGGHYYLTVKINIRGLLPLRKLILSLITSLLFIPIALILYQHNFMRAISLVVVITIVITVILKKRELFYKFGKR